MFSFLEWMVGVHLKKYSSDLSVGGSGKRCPFGQANFIKLN